MSFGVDAKANGWLFISGQAGAGENGKIVSGGFLAQGRQAFASLRRALQAGGASLKDVKVTIFVTDMGHFDDVVTLRREFFAAPYKASATRLMPQMPAVRMRRAARWRLMHKPCSMSSALLFALRPQRYDNRPTGVGELLAHGVALVGHGL